MARFDLRSLLAAAEEAPPVDAVEVLAAELLREVGAHDVRLLLTNLSCTALVRLSHVEPGLEWVAGHNERTESIPLAGSVYERAMFTQHIEVTAAGEGRWRVLVPVTERGDTLGLLELLLPARPDAETTEFLGGAAHAFAYCLVAARRHSDMFERAQRDVVFSVPAEIQRRLLPPAYSVEGGPFSLAGWLEPAHDVGGDTFDYSVDREHLHVTITDAIGHSTTAALLATLTVASLRNSRRNLAGPAAQADSANVELLNHVDSEQFVTGLIVRIGLGDGRAELVNAGHPAPYLVRQGLPEQLHLDTGLPLGVAEVPYQVQTFQLEPGDRLVLVTDGYLERNAANVDMRATLSATAARHPRQIVQELADLVVHATGGKLRDDAAVVCIDWHGPGNLRHATSGASLDRTTPV